jgi:hypothetical protein
MHIKYKMHIKPHIKTALASHIKHQTPVAAGSGRGVCVWGRKECESTKRHAVKVVRMCEK